ncbi:DMT family transporter [Oxalobacter sp. OxGP1]|uniref:EamA family transporter n=1 Tax=Oxalobacter paeniformigenes TaxID=2946594 RepID=UPI0022B0732C|nr:EamA family transporter [Oxalobacter paeniformigenes]MCZ4052567.1 DMT family transporter [Oxalobacter paeniformigenes]
MDARVKGTICGIVAAVSYGTNPLGALFLYAHGISAHSVLFYRFLLAALVLGGLMLVRRVDFSLSRRELGILVLLGALFGTSSLSLFVSFHYMDAGVASTLLFVYPVMVAVMMALFFREKVTWVTIFSIVLALSGIGLLYQGDGETLSMTGVLLVMLSSLTYAVYIIVVNKSSMVMSPVKLTFYVLLFCVLTVASHAFVGGHGGIQWLDEPAMWGYALLLALVPTVISLIMMVVAVQNVGSTPTAIMGALEPLTAVVIGVGVFGERLTMQLVVGIVLILAAVVLIIAGRALSRQALVHALHRLSSHRGRFR